MCKSNHMKAVINFNSDSQQTQSGIECLNSIRKSNETGCLNISSRFQNISIVCDKATDKRGKQTMRPMFSPKRAGYQVFRLKKINLLLPRESFMAAEAMLEYMAR